MKLRLLLPLSVLALLGAGGTVAGQGSGTTLYALTSGGQIVTVNSAAPSVALSTVSVSGINTGESLFSIDFRTANGQLYGLGTNNATGASSVYTINPLTGAAAVVGTAGGIALPVGASPVADFNPVADRLRVVTGFGSGNFRVNQLNGTLVTPPDTALAYATGDAGFGLTPNIRGVSYTNSFAGASLTTLYGVDTSRRTLVTIGSVNGSPTSPNSGQLFTVGSLGLFFASNAIGFEILSSGQAFLVARTNVPSFGGEPEGSLPASLYSVNLATGAATFVGSFASSIGSDFISLTAVPVPEPSTVAFVAAAAALGVMVRRRRR